jgi:hypothetical protein
MMPATMRRFLGIDQDQTGTPPRVCVSPTLPRRGSVAPDRARIGWNLPGTVEETRAAVRLFRFKEKPRLGG